MRRKSKLIIAFTTLVALTLMGSIMVQGLKKEINEKERVVMNVNDMNKEEYTNKISFKELGVQFYINDIYEEYMKNKILYFERTKYPNEIRGYFITSEDMKTIKKEKLDEEDSKLYEKDLFLIKVIDKNNDFLQSNVDELERKYAKHEKIGEVKNYEYYLWYNDVILNPSLNEKAMLEVNQIIEGLQFVKDHIEIFEIE